MKKTTIILFLFAFFAISCGIFRKPETQQKQNPAIFDEGVVINGVRWATRNVDMPGTFAEFPESFGMYFQWNSRIGWNSIDEEIEQFESVTRLGRDWYAENCPCPPGWRVPNNQELEKLRSAGSTWTTKNGVVGRLFGVAPYQIFLPAAGHRSPRLAGARGMIGVFNLVGVVGNYWFGWEAGGTNSRCLWFTKGGAYRSTCGRCFGLSVRCVAIE